MKVWEKYNPGRRQTSLSGKLPPTCGPQFLQVSNGKVDPDGQEIFRREGRAMFWCQSRSES